MDEIKVNGRVVVVGIEVSLKPRPGLKNGRYVVRDMEKSSSGKQILSVDGPMTGRSAWNWTRHYIYPEQIATVHNTKKAS